MNAQETAQKILNLREIEYRDVVTVNIDGETVEEIGTAADLRRMAEDYVLLRAAAEKVRDAAFAWADYELDEEFGDGAGAKFAALAEELK